MIDQLDDQQDQRMYEALYAGRKIEAIKMHREATGAGLKESKDFVDALEAQLRTESPEKFTAPPARGCGSAVVIVTITLCIALILAAM